MQEPVVIARRHHEPGATVREAGFLREHRVRRRIERGPRIADERVVGREPPDFALRHLPEARLHLERIEQPRLHEPLEAHAAGDLDHPAHHVEPDRIAPLGAGVRDQRQRRDAVGEFLERLRPDGPHLLFHRRADRQRQDAEPLIFLEQRPLGDDRVAEPGGVRQQVADRDRPRRRARGERGVGAGRHLHVLERRDIFADRIVEVQLAVLDQHHRGHAGDRLGHGVDTPQRVGPRRRSIRVVTDLARGGEERRTVADAERPDDPRHLVLRDVAVEQRRRRGQERAHRNRHPRRRTNLWRRLRARLSLLGIGRSGGQCGEAARNPVHQFHADLRMARLRMVFPALAKTVGSPAVSRSSIGHHSLAVGTRG